MILIPAIDLQAGCCVRLKQGQFNQVTSFAISPVERASYFAKLGAKQLHVVDLDGARMGSMQQLPLICAMQNTGINIQAGGGIRTLDQAQECMASGLSQLVIGSIAISDPLLTEQIINTIGAKHIILALDVRLHDNLPIPLTHGWQNTSDRNLWEVVAHYQALGIKTILCTDIACDGMMQGPNFLLYQEAVERFPGIKWQASGGIRHAQDIKLLKQLGVAAAILGLTLYQNDFNMHELLSENSPSKGALLC